MKDITCLRCKKAWHYSNEWKEKLPKTSGGKNDTVCLSTKMITLTKNQYKSDGDRREVGGNTQVETPQKEKSSEDESSKDDGMFSDEDYEGFAFVHDMSLCP